MSYKYLMRIIDDIVDKVKADLNKFKDEGGNGDFYKSSNYIDMISGLIGRLFYAIMTYFFNEE